jgi:hypothetical protein
MATMLTPKCTMVRTLRAGIGDNVLCVYAVGNFMSSLLIDGIGVIACLRGQVVIDHC